MPDQFLEDEELPTPPPQTKDDRDEILVGYLWSKSRKRFVSTRTGKPISDTELRRLFNAHIEDAEGRMGEIATAFHEGRIAPAVFVEQMAIEQRRHTIQSTALGSGGFDEIDAMALIGLGLLLRSTNDKIVGTARDVLEGKVTLPQLLNRTEGYVGEGRVTFFDAMRRGLLAGLGIDSSTLTIERRQLNAKKSCADCVRYYQMGWQQTGVLPMPSVNCACGSHCRCNFLQRVIQRTELEQWVGTMR